MSVKHKYIYLQSEEDADSSSDITWCQDQINDSDIKYILFSDHERELAEARRMCFHQERFKYEANRRADKAESAFEELKELANKTLECIGEDGAYPPVAWCKLLAEGILRIAANLPKPKEGWVSVPVSVLDKLYEWDKKWPKGTVFSYGRHKKCESELDSILDTLIASRPKPT